MSHKTLLAKHKVSSEWYTPDYIWKLSTFIFNYTIDEILDTCPVFGYVGL